MSMQSPSRLLIVLTSDVRGGVEEVALSLLQRLDRKEFEPALAAPAGLLETMQSELAALDVPTFRAAADSWLRWREVRALASAIRAFRPDVVNPHLFRSTLVAAPLARGLGVPAVVETYHGREAWRRGPIRGSFVVDRFISRAVNLVIAVSEAAKDFLVRVKRLPSEKVVVVPNGRDLSVFKPGCGGGRLRRELGLPPDASVLGVFGRLEEQKGHRYGLEAFARVVRDHPKARLLIVGDGALRQALEAQARGLGLEGHVTFTGYRDDIPDLLDAVDVVVLPSLYEGMPLTAIEAAAMAKPVVATAVDGTTEVVVDGATGTLVPAADAAALATAICRILASPDRGQALGQRGRQRALARFSVTASAAATAEVYRASLKAPGPRATMASRDRPHEAS